MYINSPSTNINDNTNNYSITSSLTNVFNRVVAIVSSIFSHLPFFSSEADNNVLPEDNIGIEEALLNKN